jgi:hypothetical protein
MNIFVTDPDPKVAASHLDDKRVNKMILETVQMLSVHLNGPYKPTHINHPCTIWVGQSKANLYWTWRYLVCLHNEYKKRRNRDHLSFTKFIDMHGSIDYAEDPTEFCNCSAYTDCDDVFTAYQLTLADKWESDKRTPTWYGVER